LFALGFAYAHTGGFDSERIRYDFEAMTEWRFGRQPTEDEVHGAAFSIVALASAGSAFGVLCAGATKTIPLPGAVIGGVCGLGTWAAGEAIYRSMPGRQRKWGFPPLAQTVPKLASYGVAVALASRRRD
jgi:hypothetical protein